MTDPNPMRIAEEMRHNIAVLKDRVPVRKHIVRLGGFSDCGIYGTDAELDAISYIANNAIALADALEEERKHSDRLAEELHRCHDQLRCNNKSCTTVAVLATHRERRKP